MKRMLVIAAFVAGLSGRALFAQVVPSPGAAELGWYRVQLQDNTSMTARLVEVEKDFYLLSFEGTILRVAKNSVREMKKIENDLAGSPASPAAGGGNAGGAPSPEKAARAAKIRDALESLGTTSDEAVDKAYRSLAKDFEEARPFAHAAISHQNPRVRKLATKLLGENGNADQDLVPVTGRLSDARPEVRLAAVMAVRALGPKGLPALLEYLEKENVPNNRKMAVKTFQRWNDRRAVGPLVERLAKEKDQGVQGFIEVALQVLTGQKLGRNPEAWANYLSEQKHYRELDQLTQPPETEVKIMEGAPSAKE